jgi:hypothetical protein
LRGTKDFSKRIERLNVHQFSIEPNKVFIYFFPFLVTIKRPESIHDVLVYEANKSVFGVKTEIKAGNAILLNSNYKLPTVTYLVS